MITQIELAKHLGVSQQAVSFALNGGGTLKEATRRRIVEEARRMGYRRSAAARAMQTGKTRNIGLLSFGHAQSRMPPALLSGLATMLDREEYSLSLVNVYPDQLDDPDTVPLVFREHRVDGCVVLLDPESEGRLPELLESLNMPTIWVNRKQARNAVYPDDERLGAAATRHLLARGHRRIAYLGPGDLSVHFSQGDRLQGYVEALREAGGKPELLMVNSPDGYGRLGDILKRKRGRPTALLCYGVQQADMVMLEAARLGLRVPEDVGVLVIDQAGAHIGTILYSLLRIPLFYVGTHTVELLQKRIANGNRPVKSIAVKGEQFDEGQTL